MRSYEPPASASAQLLGVSCAYQTWVTIPFAVIRPNSDASCRREEGFTAGESRDDACSFPSSGYFSRRCDGRRSCWRPCPALVVPGPKQPNEKNKTKNRNPKVDKKDLTTSDPFLKIARVLETGECVYVFKTEVQSRTLNPKWKQIQVRCLRWARVACPPECLLPAS